MSPIIKRITAVATPSSLPDWDEVRLLRYSPPSIVPEKKNAQAITNNLSNVLGMIHFHPMFFVRSHTNQYLVGSLNIYIQILRRVVKERLYKLFLEDVAHS